MTATGDVAGEVADLAALAQGGGAPGVLWAHAGADLNANLVLLTSGGTAPGVPAHVNDEVDVLLVGIAGTGTIEIDGRPHVLGAGQALVIPRGTRRAIGATTERFAYLTCHRRRAGLWPGGPRRAAGEPGPGW